ncbi:MAG: TIGR02221 family CRISPR-associated protein [Rhizonema sp. PD38]|nr:TIGR02221 family CRISPR-associated protein [Rhizonema sp. PD38]
MAKILISPLGVGGKFKNQVTHDREYQGACYQIDNISYPQSRFMASVLYEHFDLDGIIFIGTVKSMWEEVYRFFCEKKAVIKNDEYWLDLALKIDHLNYESTLDSLDLSKVTEILGERSKCILIKYGINQPELWENFDTIIQIIDFLKKGDKIYIDITHSFRSLSLFLFLTTTFLKDLVSEKEIEIAGVYYGMLDVTREIGYTPVVDLKPLFDITAWIKGAYSLKSYGDGRLIAELLKAQSEEQIANQINLLSQALNINDVTAIKDKSGILKNSLQNKVVNGPFKYLRKVLENFVQKFARSSLTESEYQLELAGWYFDNQRYATGYITLTEAVITYICEINNKDPKIKVERELMKDFIHKSENRDSKLAELYFKVNPIRNSIAHALLEKNNSTSEKKAIEQAKKCYQEAKEIFITRTLI